MFELASAAVLWWRWLEGKKRHGFKPAQEASDMTNYVRRQPAGLGCLAQVSGSSKRGRNHASRPCIFKHF